MRRRERLSGFRMEIPVRFSECDAYGVVWHGNYAVYLEEIRNAVCARFGWTVESARRRGYLVPVTRMEIEYHSPARLDGRIVAVARLRPPDVARFVMDYELSAPDGRLLTTAVTEQVCTREDGELLLALPDFLRELARRILAGQDDPAQQNLSP